MRLSALLFLTFFYLCPVRAQIDSICLVNHGPISVLSSKGFWDPKYGVEYPTFSIPLYNRYKQISYSLNTIEVRYRGNDSLFIVFPLSRSKAIVSSEIKEFKVRTVEREDFFVEGVSRKTMDRRYRNRMLLYLKGENARGEALFNRNPHKQSFKILEPLMGTMHAYSILQDSSFFEVIKLPAVQKGVAGTFGPGLFVSIGRTTTDRMSFYKTRSCVRICQYAADFQFFP